MLSVSELVINVPRENLTGPNAEDIILYSAKVYNGNLYAYGNYTTNSNYYYYSKFFKYNNTNNSFEIIWNFPDGGLGSFASRLYFNNNNTFFVPNENSSLIEGLYKLNLSTLNTLENSVSEKKLIIFPNPSNSFLNIQTDSEITAIKIIDITGRSTRINNFLNKRIDVSSLLNGVYFIEIQTNEGILKSKFIKQ